MKDIPSPGKTRSVLESRLQDISTMVKQDQQSHPNVSTNPDRSCTYLVLRAHRIGQATSKTNPRVAPRWPRRLPVSDQHSEEHWHGGFKIKMALESVEPKGKRLRWQMVKPKLGLAGGVLFKANCQGVPIITQPRKERKIKDHNTGMTETRAARVEQNTRHKAEPSTLYQVYSCIN